MFEVLRYGWKCFWRCFLHGAPISLCIRVVPIPSAAVVLPQMGIPQPGPWVQQAGRPCRSVSHVSPAWLVIRIRTKSCGGGSGLPDFFTPSRRWDGFYINTASLRHRTLEEQLEFTELGESQTITTLYLGPAHCADNWPSPSLCSSPRATLQDERRCPSSICHLHAHSANSFCKDHQIFADGQ
jgi:hypothetical protein